MNEIYEETRKHLVTSEADKPVKMVLKGQYKEAYEMLRDADAAQCAPVIMGPVGCGKTLLARYYAKQSGRPFRLLSLASSMRPEHLLGSFDPYAVTEWGYCPKAFKPGPLIEMMEKGGIFIADWLNYAPEYLQNKFIEPIVKRSINIPYVGEIKASDGFFFIAIVTSGNIAETYGLSEALKNCLNPWIKLDYPPRDLEIEIIKENTPQKIDEDILEKIRDILEVARNNPMMRPPSIRAGISMAKTFAVKNKRGHVQDKYKELREISKGVLWGHVKITTRKNYQDILNAILDKALGRKA